MEEAVAEAELVIGELGSYEITYPVAVDIERVEGQVARQDALSKEKRTEVCLAFWVRLLIIFFYKKKFLCNFFVIHCIFI